MEGVAQNMNNPSAESEIRPELIRVGPYGKSTHLGSPHNQWSFQLVRHHRLKNITIDHGDLIYSLIFTSQLGDATYTSDKIGGVGRGPMEEGDKISEITFDGDEEINGISGTVALSRGDKPGFIIISSLSFTTNKKTHGPFGTVRGDPFSVSWGDATCAGFYGLSGGFLDSIGVYLKPQVEILRIGTWGSGGVYNPQRVWSFQLEANQRLNSINVVHSLNPYLRRVAINQLIFNSVDEIHSPDMVRLDTIRLDGDEEIIGISGTFLETVIFDGDLEISSITFKTNKRDYGPLGVVKGTPFSASLDVGSFAGFYGFTGRYLNSIGVYLKSTDGIKV